MPASGMEMMLGSMLKNMGIDKDALMGQVAQAQGVVSTVDARVTRMERKIDAIHDLIVAWMHTERQHTSNVLPAGETSLFLEHGADDHLTITEIVRA